MGGGGVAEDMLSCLDSPSEEELSVDEDLPQTLPREAEEEAAIPDEEHDEITCVSSPAFESQAKLRRDRAYREVLKSYDDLHGRSEGLAQLKSKIRSYRPGSWVEEIGGLRSSDYQVPQTACLLFIGPKGSGKSSLVNRISRVVEDDNFAPDRAQVSYNSTSGGDGTCFIQEYMVPRDSNGFCIFDTRGLSANHMENTEKIKLWMTQGISHGDPVIRESDDPILRERMKSKALWNHHKSTVMRTVNFVVYVVNGLSVLKSVEGNGGESQDTDLISRTYDLPYLSFNDDKAVVVVTHGDLLSIEERSRVRVHLGELLGIHPERQIFDIPVTDGSDPATELAMLDMLRYSLEHADRNLPRETKTETIWSNKNKVGMWKTWCIYLIQLLAIAVLLCVCVIQILAIARSFHDHHPPQPAPHDHPPPTSHSAPHDHPPVITQSVPHHRPRTTSEIHIDWPSIRHMWSG